MKKSTYLQFKGVKNRLTAIEAILAPLVGSYIADRDVIDAELRADIADLTANNADLQGGLNAAFTKAEQARAKLSPT